MRSRLVTAALVVAMLTAGGCSSSTASPSSGAVGSAPAGSAGPTAPIASVLVAYDTTLLALMPLQIGGVECTREAVNLAQFMEQVPPSAEAMQAYRSLADAVGVGIDKLTLGDSTCPLIVNGAGVTGAYEVYRAEGGDRTRLVAGFLALTTAQGGTTPVLSPATVGGRQVTKATFTDTSTAVPTIAYLYQKDDVLFIVRSAGPDADALVLAALP